MITGPTGGIGRAAAVALAAKGASLALVCRDVARGEALAAELRAAGARGAVDVVRADFASQPSIREAAAELLRRYPRIDVLINNAGAIFTSRKSTAEGLELTFAVNHLGYVLLTALLLDRLRASAPARIINVASAAHHRGHIHFDDLQLERRWGSWRAYGQSKLANVLYTYELARRLEGSGVTVNALHPGVVATGFGRNDGALMRIAVKLAAPFLIGPEKGAETTIYLASSPEVEGTTGKYFARCKPARSSRESRDADVARRLFELSERLVGLA